MQIDWTNKKLLELKKNLVKIRNSFFVKTCGDQVIRLNNSEKQKIKFWKLTHRVLQRHKLPKLWREQQIKVISSCSFYFGDLSRLNEGENFECQ